MKVTLKFDQKAYSGKLDGLVYYWHPRLQMLIARKAPDKKSPRAENISFAAVSRNLKVLSPSPAYRQDLQTYLLLLQEEGYFPKLHSWYLLYTRLMHIFAQRHPEYSLDTLTREQIQGEVLSCRSVKSAVEDLLLPMVAGYENLVVEL